MERPNDLAVVSTASASLLKTASIKSNDLTLKLPRVVSFLICYILGSKKCVFKRLSRFSCCYSFKYFGFSLGFVAEIGYQHLKVAGHLGISMD